MNTLTTQPARTGTELAVAAQAAAAKALIEARFTVALHNPRNALNARNAILEACRRPAFALAALYAKPVGNTRIVGLSIRFAEEALRAWGNVDVQATIVYEDDAQRQVRISIVDLERNITYSDDVILAKTVERRNVREGQTVLGSRENSTGETVYLIAASEDELANKIAAAKSKSIRNSGLRLIPGDFLEEARAEIEATRKNRQAADPNAEIKQIVDAFAGLRVQPSELAKYLGHPIESVSPAEIDDLRSIYSALRDGETSWTSILEAQSAGAQGPKPDLVTPTGTPQPPAGTPRRGRKPRQGAPEGSPPAQDTPPPAPTPQTAQESQQPAGNVPRGTGAPSPFTLVSNPLDEQEPGKPAPASPADRLRAALKAEGVTEGECLKACESVDLPVSNTLDSTGAGVLETILQDVPGLVDLVKTRVRRA